MTGIRLREMQEREVPRAVAIVRKTHKKDSGFAKKCYKRLFAMKSKGLGRFVDVHNYAVLLGREMIGVTGYYRKNDADDVFWLTWFYLEPKHQGKGIGNRTIEMLEKKLKTMGCRKLFVETDTQPEYRGTRTIYRKCGFKKEGVLKDYYNKKYKCVIMGKVLK